MISGHKRLPRHSRRASKSSSYLFNLFLIGAAMAQPAGTQAAEPGRYLAGHLLVATPDMRDPRFHETVIYMVSHDASGAVGLVVNRPLARVPTKDLLKGFGVEQEHATGELVVHYGGPVSPRQGFILHSDDFLLDTSIVVKDGVVMTADTQLVQAIADGKGPRQSLLAFGYAGWAPGQLEGEILASSWFTIPADSSLIFGKEPDKKWRRAMDRRKIEL